MNHKSGLRSLCASITGGSVPRLGAGGLLWIGRRMEGSREDRGVEGVVCFVADSDVRQDACAVCVPCGWTGVTTCLRLDLPAGTTDCPCFPPAYVIVSLHCLTTGLHMKRVGSREAGGCGSDTMQEPFC
jgi:hypothetical protein